MKTNLYLFLLIGCLACLPSQLWAQQVPKDSIQRQREARSLVREGNVLYTQEKYADAAIAYRKALDKNSLYKKAGFNLGNALYQDKNFKEAVPQYELATKTAKTKIERSEAFHNIGNAMMEQKNYQAAVDAYKNALRNNPNDDESRYNLAVAQKLLDEENSKKNDKNKDNKNKNDQNNKDKDNPNKDKDKDNKDGDNKDKKDPKDGDKGDKDKKDDKKDPKKDDENSKKDKPKPQQGKMSPQQIKQLLESLSNEEKKTQKKMNVNKAKGNPKKKEKDW